MLHTLNPVYLAIRRPSSLARTQRSAHGWFSRCAVLSIDEWFYFTIGSLCPSSSVQLRQPVRFEKNTELSLDLLCEFFQIEHPYFFKFIGLPVWAFNSLGFNRRWYRRWCCGVLAVNILLTVFFSTWNQDGVLVRRRKFITKQWKDKKRINEIDGYLYYLHE